MPVMKIMPALLLGAMTFGPFAAYADTPGGTKPATVVGFYRGNIGHTGVASEALTAPLSLLWRHTTQTSKNNPASAVYSGSIIYFVSASSVYALSAADGSTL